MADFTFNRRAEGMGIQVNDQRFHVFSQSDCLDGEFGARHRLVGFFKRQRAGMSGVAHYVHWEGVLFCLTIQAGFSGAQSNTALHASLFRIRIGIGQGAHQAYAHDVLIPAIAIAPSHRSAGAHDFAVLDAVAESVRRATDRLPLPFSLQ